MPAIDDLIGRPFADGGRGPETDDCWGLVLEIFRRYGLILPDYKISCEADSQIDRTVLDQLNYWRKCAPPIPVPALVVIRFNETAFCNHTGVYIGKGCFVHTREKIGVNIDRLESPSWKRKIEGIYIPGW